MKYILIMLFAGCFNYAAPAQIDSVSVKHNNLELNYIKEGNSQYVSWIKNITTGTISQLLLWERKVTFGEKYGKYVVVVSQNRIYEDSTRKTFVYTVSDRTNFETLYDYRAKDGKAKQAFNYSAEGVVAADTVEGNIKKGFSLKFNDFPFCFELDLETLCLLPFKHTGQKLAVNFYHPGGTVLPKYYPVEVLREENVNTIDGNKINCWVIKLVYDADTYDISWISKKDRQFLKLESHSPSQIYNKVRLSVSAEHF